MRVDEFKGLIEALEKNDSPQELLKYDAETSKMTLAGITVVPIHDYFLPAVFAALEGQIGPVARSLIIRYAREIGVKDGRAVREKMLEGKEPTIRAVREASRSMFKSWCQVGWGKLVKFEVKENHAVISRSTSYEGEGYLKLGKGPAKTPRCWIALGYMIGFFEGLLKRKVKGEETECIGMGAKTCTFRIEW